MHAESSDMKVMEINVFEIEDSYTSFLCLLHFELFFLSLAM
jgi:hypothetical protein